jgi:Mrp family chromosome partitioning ATPase
MSKNFELMQEALREVEQETAPLTKPATIVFPAPEANRNGHRGPENLDHLAQEECLKLVQRIFFGQPENAHRTIVFAGVDRGNGCSRICIEAARTLAANTSASICLVDANFRTPALSRFFGLSEGRGLAESLLGEGDVRSFTRQLTPSNLCLLSAGDPMLASASLLNSDRLKSRLQELGSEFEYILIDAPALNLYSDAIALGRIANGAVVVLEADSTRRESALQSVANLRDAQIEVLGAVLNRRTFPIPNFVYRRL